MLGLGVSPLYLDRTQNNTIVRPWDGWSGTPFNTFIFEQTNTNYSKEINGMKLLYQGMSDEEKAKNEVYMRCCDIIQCYAFQRSTDLYDDIPYSEAGGAFQEKFYPKYDTQEEIYTDIMARLKTAAADLSTQKRLRLILSICYVQATWTNGFVWLIPYVCVWQCVCVM